MAVHNNQQASTDAVELPDVVPLELSYLTRQSWELGKRTVEAETTTILSKWESQHSQWHLTIAEVTTETAILCLRSPAGRERFYGAIQSEVKSALDTLNTSPSWSKIR
mgnify:CR=1 FL=1